MEKRHNYVRKVRQHSLFKWSRWSTVFPLIKWQDTLTPRRTIHQTCHHQVAEVAVQLFISNDKPNCSGLILAGSADFKTELSQSDMFDSRLQVSDDELFWGVQIETSPFSGQDHQTCRHLLWWRKRIQPGLKSPQLHISMFPPLVISVHIIVNNSGHRVGSRVPCQCKVYPGEKTDWKVTEFFH